MTTFALPDTPQKADMERKFNALGSILSAPSAARSESSGAMLLLKSLTQRISSGSPAG
jgi:hypothetical protein